MPQGEETSSNSMWTKMYSYVPCELVVLWGAVFERVTLCFLALLSSSPSVQLEDCLSTFCKDELMTGDNQYQCDNCNQLRDARSVSAHRPGVISSVETSHIHVDRKTLKISKLPEVLCISLKRFKFNDLGPTKIQT